MKIFMRTFLLLVCMLLCSCAESVGDGVLIVPSSRSLYEESSAVTSETADTEDNIPMTEPVSNEEPAVSDTAADVMTVTDDGFDAAEQARLLFADETFCALLAQFGEQMDAQTAAAAAVLAYQQMQETAAEQPSFEETVFWTVGGSVWHVTAECSALAKSKSILSGSETEAQQAGKTRACKRCGG